MFFCLSKLLFYGLPQVEGCFEGAENDSKYRDVAPLNSALKLRIVDLPSSQCFVQNS